MPSSPSRVARAALAGVRAAPHAVAAVYPSYEMLGWYAIGPKLTPAHMDVHLQVTALNESPLFLLLDPTALASHTRELPLTIYMADYRAGGAAAPVADPRVSLHATHSHPPLSLPQAAPSLSLHPCLSRWRRQRWRRWQWTT